MEAHGVSITTADLGGHLPLLTSSSYHLCSRHKQTLTSQSTRTSSGAVSDPVTIAARSAFATRMPSRPGSRPTNFGMSGISSTPVAMLQEMTMSAAAAAAPQLFRTSSGASVHLHDQAERHVSTLVRCET